MIPETTAYNLKDYFPLCDFDEGKTILTTKTQSHKENKGYFAIAQ